MKDLLIRAVGGPTALYALTLAIVGFTIVAAATVAIGRWLAYRRADAYRTSPQGKWDRAELAMAEQAIEHEEVAGWGGGGPGQCGVECACGVTYDGFDTIAEAAHLLDHHIASAVLARRPLARQEATR